ncbi:MAG: cysteine synthase A [Planctomycetaceae bacterium]|nr:Cysteine synthase [Planctomycetota bacterium]MCQ3950658.1 cysteine synthase A [Planctomycetota bacterium]NUO15117.1 cysteine synthase A [Planctomycetaceae bacterium]GIK51638.1 MAG: cysteine synthase [Planctomycetota bacterium]HRJ77561.1 cysteine synthase A [Planctomycetota bacterium]
MAKRVNAIHELIGDTPVVRLNRMVPANAATVYAKIEYANPGCSVKDRIALSMIQEAEKRGELTPGKSVIVEGTSGNTGIGLALVAASKGYKCILCMPESMTVERRNTLKAYGAELVLTPASEGMRGAVNKAKEIVSQNPNAWEARQFDNADNPLIHRNTTGPEILQQVPELDALVAGIGTGGTVSGAGRVIKAAKPHVKVYAVEPKDSPLLTEGKAGPHKIQGIGANFVPSILDREVYDQVIDVTYPDAIATARRLCREEGIFSGISTGAICFAALDVARKLGKGKTVVFVVCDYGERYSTHELWAQA